MTNALPSASIQQARAAARDGLAMWLERLRRDGAPLVSVDLEMLGLKNEHVPRILGACSNDELISFAALLAASHSFGELTRIIREAAVEKYPGLAASELAEAVNDIRATPWAFAVSDDGVRDRLRNACARYLAFSEPKKETK